MGGLLPRPLALPVCDRPGSVESCTSLFPPPTSHPTYLQTIAPNSVARRYRQAHHVRRPHLRLQPGAATSQCWFGSISE